MTNDALLAIGDFIFSASALPAIAFLVYYAWPKLGAHWWKTLVGRMFVLSQVSLILVSLVVILSLTLGQEYPGRAIFRIIGYSMHFIAQVAVLTTYYRVRHENVLPPREAEENAPTK